MKLIIVVAQHEKARPQYRKKKKKIENGHWGVKDLHIYKWSWKEIHEKWIMGDDEESLVVRCATNHGDQLSKLQNLVSTTFNNFQGWWSLTPQP
jgi:hypothetical protein